MEASQAGDGDRHHDLRVQKITGETGVYASQLRLIISLFLIFGGFLSLTAAVLLAPTSGQNGPLITANDYAETLIVAVLGIGLMICGIIAYSPGRRGKALR